MTIIKKIASECIKIAKEDPRKNIIGLDKLTKYYNFQW